MLFFAYGSLKRGCCRNDALLAAAFVGEAATLPKYKMYDLESFPALVECQDGISIKGELYQIENEELWESLDMIECAPYLYKRLPIEIEGVSDPVFGYIFQRDVDGFQECGDCWHEKFAEVGM